MLIAFQLLQVHAGPIMENCNSSYFYGALAIYKAIWGLELKFKSGARTKNVPIHHGSLPLNLGLFVFRILLVSLHILVSFQ